MASPSDGTDLPSALTPNGKDIIRFGEFTSIQMHRSTPFAPASLTRSSTKIDRASDPARLRLNIQIKSVNDVPIVNYTLVVWSRFRYHFVSELCSRKRKNSDAWRPDRAVAPRPRT